MFEQALPASVGTIPTDPTSPDAIRFETMTLPVLPVVRSRAKRGGSDGPKWYDDRWFLALIVCAGCASVGAAVWAYRAQTILLYADAHAHLLIARRVLDNLYPGLAQLGDVWLPLSHIIMLPLAWNDFLWRTGLAGTLTSMPCYLIASMYVFLTARRLTHDSRASFIGSLVFVLNPNILYLQTTPLSEPVLFATLAAASYYLIAWTQTEHLRDLLGAALATFLATIARYDGWALFLALVAAIILIGWQKRQTRAKTVADVILFSTLGGIGIVFWFVWNLVIFGSPTAFLSGSYSSQNQTRTFILRGVASDYHNLWLSLRSYVFATAESIGPAILAIMVLAIAVFLLRRRLTGEVIASLTVLVPFAFYVVALYFGQDVLYVPHADFPPLLTYFNARFGAEMAAPAAVFVATLAGSLKRWVNTAQLGLAFVVVAQSICLSWGGIISLQDGQVGSSCYIAHPIVAFLAEHYDGGRLLVNLYSTNIDLSPAGIPFRSEIYEGDGAAWAEALQTPSRFVEWIITSPHDLISQHINTASAAFRNQYSLVAQEGSTGVALWHLEGLAPLPTRPLPQDVAQPYAACNRAKGIPLAYAAGSPATSALPSVVARLAAPPADTRSPFVARLREDMT
jgi:hypothetical protein